MVRNRIIVAIFVSMVAALFCSVAGQGANSVPGKNGPELGKWTFTGKDNTGLAWAGFLSIEKLDPSRFDPKQYYALCSLEVESSDLSKGTRGVEAPCAWDARTRTLSFTTGFTTEHRYTAILSPEGASLSQGKWTESRKSGQSGETIVRSGTWSAKRPTH